MTDSSGMKLPLATVLLSAAVMGGCGGSTTAGRYVMRVDRAYDRGSQSELPSDDLPPESYHPMPPSDRWDVTIDGSRVVLVPIGQEHPGGVKRLEGKETSSAGGERRFEIREGAFAGGLFVMRGDEAELTMFGSGVPIVSSERGKLVSR